jgi:cytochrome c553
MKTIARVVFGAALLFALVSEGYAQSAGWRANIAVCAGCHGAHGEGSSTGAPRLAGQNTEYLSHALSMFKAKTRASAIMQPIAQGLSDADSQALAAYFAAQSGPFVEGKSPVSPQIFDAGRQLAATGPTPCFSCHGVAGQGNGARYPAIAGQPAQFVVDRLHEFQQRARQKTPQPGTMTAVSVTMSEEQIQAYAAYLSRLPR